MMKSLAAFGFIFLLAASANAALMISVNGVIQPPLGEIVLQPGDTAVIGIHGDGLTPSPIAAYLLVEGPGSIDGYTMLYPSSLAIYDELEAVADALGMSLADFLAAFRDLTGRTDLQDVSLITLAPDRVPMSPALDGLLVDDIILHCDGLGDVTLTLVGDDVTIIYDTQAVQQIRQPMTLLLLVLLGLGTLFIVASLFALARRRRKQQA
jgi:hypothetical protein